MATGDYGLAQRAGVYHMVPAKPRRYYTVYYQCDGLIKNANDLLLRLCNDTDEEDGLLRLVPDQGKNLWSSLARARRTLGRTSSS